MSIIKYHKILCPLCHTTFETRIIESVITFKGRETDFRIHAQGIDPLPHFAIICPNCHYVAYSMDDPLDDRLVEFVQSTQYSQPLENEKVLDFSEPSTKHVLLARIFEHQTESNEKIAREYLSAAWLARSLNKREDEKEYQRLALNHFVNAEKNQEVSEDQINIIRYLIGEINRRLGDFQNALAYFSKVDKSKFDLTLLEQQIKLTEEGNLNAAWFPNGFRTKI